MPMLCDVIFRDFTREELQLLTIFRGLACPPVLRLTQTAAEPKTDASPSSWTTLGRVVVVVVVVVFVAWLLLHRALHHKRNLAVDCHRLHL
jgi:hypothetical protein